MQETSRVISMQPESLQNRYFMEDDQEEECHCKKCATICTIVSSIGFVLTCCCGCCGKQNEHGRPSAV